MKRIFTFIGLFILSIVALKAQETLFTPVDLANNYWFNSLDWGDYNNDGKADLVIAGALPDSTGYNVSTNSTTHIYSNDGNGNMILKDSIDIRGVHAGDTRWVDFNNDGNLDLVVSGINYGLGFGAFAIYKNEGGRFVSVKESFEGVMFGSIDVADYDNDGDLDLLATGWAKVGSNYLFVTYIWENQNGEYVKKDITEQVPGIMYGRANWVDIDNDMDMDIIISGHKTEGNPDIRIYKNNNGTFTLDQTISGIKSFGRIALGDYDNDGDLDIAVMTMDDDYKKFVSIYNNNAGNFERIAHLPGLSVSAGATPLAWGDYDNDGDLDLIVNGTAKNASDNGAILYRNNNNNFEAVTNTGFLAIGGNSLAWQDIDGDLDLDLLVSGFYKDPSNNEYYAVSKIYKNNSTTANTKPNPPTTLNSSVEGNTVILNWSGATDEQTPTAGLNYFLKVGTSSGAGDFAAYKLTGTSWKLKNLPANQNMYWCVKSIDTSFIQSDCSEEHSFSTMSTHDILSKENALTIYPNPVKDGVINLISKENSGNNLNIKIYDVTGRVLIKKEIKFEGNKITIPVNELSAGTYLLKYKTQKEEATLQFIVK